MKSVGSGDENGLARKLQDAPFQPRHPVFSRQPPKLPSEAGPADASSNALGARLEAATERLRRPGLFGEHSRPGGGSQALFQPVEARAAAEDTPTKPYGTTALATQRPAGAGSAGGAAADRLARLAQQRQRLAEQRARLAAGKTAAANPTGAAEPARGPPAESRSSGRPAVPSDGSVPFQENGSHQPSQTLARASASGSPDAAVRSNEPDTRPWEPSDQSWEVAPAARAASTHASDAAPEPVEPQPPVPVGSPGIEAAAALGPDSARDAPDGRLASPHAVETVTDAPIPFGLASAGGSGSDFFRGGLDTAEPASSAGFGDAASAQGLWGPRVNGGTHPGNPAASHPDFAAAAHGAGHADAGIGRTAQTSAAHWLEQTEATSDRQPEEHQWSTAGPKSVTGNAQAIAQWHPGPPSSVAPGGPRSGVASDGPLLPQSLSEQTHSLEYGHGSIAAPGAASSGQLPAGPPAVAGGAAEWDTAADSGIDFFADSPLGGRPPAAANPDSNHFHAPGLTTGGSAAAIAPGSTPTPPLQGSGGDAAERPSPFADGRLQEPTFSWDDEARQRSAEYPNGSDMVAWQHQGHETAYHDPQQHPQPNAAPAPSWTPAPAEDVHYGWAAEPASTDAGAAYGQPFSASAAQNGLAHTPSFHTWGTQQPSYAPPAHAWEASVRQQAAVSGPSRTAEDALRSPHGRPPVPLVAFGFGGRAVMMHPQPSPLAGAAGERLLALGPLQLCSVRELPAAAAAAGGRRVGQSAEEATQDSDFNMLREMPDALTASASRAKVVDFIARREACAAAEAGDGEDPVAARLLWGVLRLLALNRGTLQSPADGSGKAKPLSVEKQLTELLRPANGSGSNGTGATANGHAAAWDDGRVLADAAPGQGGPEEAGQQMQALLLAGDRAAALRVAVDARLWGPALLLARLCGEAAFRETALAVADRAVRPGTPLASLLRATAGPDTDAAPGTAGNGPTPQAVDAAHSDPSAEIRDWRGCVAILAANQGPHSSAGLLRLGDQLWSGSRKVLAAHLCYVLGGVVPSAFEPGARLCLPGGDHRCRPRTFASSAAIQRALVLEWARQSGSASSPQAAAAVLPYRYVLAAQMAEQGLVEAASQQCSVLAGALNAFGNRLPGGLLMARSLTNELQLRLQTHAQAMNISITHSAGGSLMSKAGKWLDKGLSRLIGAADLPDNLRDPQGRPPQPGQPQQHQQQQQQHRRSASQPASPRAQMYRRVSSTGEIVCNGAVSHSPPSRAPPPGPRPGAPHSPPRPPSMDKAGSLSVRGLIGKVGSFTSLLGPSSGAQKNEAALGAENTLYFDNELKIWRERGKPPPEPEAPLAPPPTSLPAPAAGNSGPPGDGGPPPPPLLSSSGSTGISPAHAGGVRSRYVDTVPVTTSRQPSSGAIPRPPGGSALLPRPPAFFTPPGAAPPALFTPAAGGGQAAAARPRWAAPGHPGHRHSASAPAAGAGSAQQPQQQWGWSANGTSGGATAMQAPSTQPNFPAIDANTNGQPGVPPARGSMSDVYF